MQVTLISPKEINSDLGIVNCARVSLSKRHETFDTKTDSRLLKYLFKHSHWTPFAHPSVYFSLRWDNPNDEIGFYKYRNPAGFQHTPSPLGEPNTDWIKGSLYAWLNNLQYLPKTMREMVLFEISLIYPFTIEAYMGLKEVDPFIHHKGSHILYEPYIRDNGVEDLLSKTILVKCPIAIARQIRTSQVGFAYADSYVEGESFVFNEVSRRYVSDEPEFYSVKQWRVREGESVKQGSTGRASDVKNTFMSTLADEALTQAKHWYEYGKTYNIAPEQLRFILPQSMYTEFYMTGTVKRWKQFISLRSKPDVQEETRELVSLISSALNLT